MISSALALYHRWLAAAWTKNPKLGLGMIGSSVAITVLIGFAGPSAVALNLGPRESLLPPWYLPLRYANWNEWVVAGALWLGISMGVAGLWVCWRANKEGWHAPGWKLFGLGAGLSTATCLVLPMTSADVLMYAAYGRLQAIGQNPYDITPAMIFRQAFDPVLIYTERPWQDTPSVYGPVASASQWLAATLGGQNMHDVVFWLQLMALLPFLVIGLVALRMTKADPVRQTRAVLFTVLNPLLIWAVLAGAHNEALTLVFAVLGLMFLRRYPLLAGIGIGLAGTVKVSLVFYGIAMLWGYRRDWRKLLLLGVGAAIPLLLAYGLWAPQALLAAQRNTGYVSNGSWAAPVLSLLSLVFGQPNAHWFVTHVSWVLMAAVAWMLSRTLPWKAAPGVEDGQCRNDSLTIAARTAVILTTAWLLTSPYTLSWYDLIIWVPLGMLASSKLDSVLMWRGTWLSLAYVTGRAYQFSDEMLFTSAAIRDVICAGVQIAVVAAIVIWWWRDGHELPPLRGLLQRRLVKRS
ncbi:MAG: polyprenol phosphomannose-dependent alpha 1,6 mannosyltransferase MptB [Propionibacteriaceae bacterium]|nr:polyprenol phosphomannose-dependent alpha 1,6 mannosyltransferase MptB [Propionibacteriaceae bacterium]